MKKIALPLMLLVSLHPGSIRAESIAQLALEDFVGNPPDLVTGTTTEASHDEDIIFIVVDIDGDSINEIFVSRNDLASENLWRLYQEQPDGSGGVTDLGMVHMNLVTMRLAEREGVSGYYEIYPRGAGESSLVFNTIKDGTLTATWETVVTKGDGNQELVESLHFGRFDAEARRPVVETAPVAPLRHSFANREAGRIAGSSADRAERRPDLDTPVGNPRSGGRGSESESGGDDGADRNIADRLAWIAGLALLVVSGCYYWIKRRKASFSSGA